MAAQHAAGVFVQRFAPFIASNKPCNYVARHVGVIPRLVGMSGRRLTAAAAAAATTLPPLSAMHGTNHFCPPVK